MSKNFRYRLKVSTKPMIALTRENKFDGGEI